VRIKEEEGYDEIIKEVVKRLVENDLYEKNTSGRLGR